MATNTHRKALLFFVFTVFIAAFIAIWGLFLNNGSIVFKGESPYTISIGGGETKTCNESSCEINLSPGNYSIVLEKEGYFKIAKEIKIERWQKVEEQIEFVLIPFQEQVGDFIETNDENIFTILNTNFLQLAPINFELNTEFSDLKQIIPSPSGDFFITEDASENFKLFNSDQVEIELNQEISNFNWTNNDILFFLDRDPVSGQYSLMKYNPFTDVKEVITPFIKSSADFAIYTGSSLEKVIVSETNDSESILYLVDLLEKSKKEVARLAPVKSINLSPRATYAAVTLADDSRQLVLLASNSVKQIQNGVSANREAFLDEDNLLIVTNLNDLSEANIDQNAVLENSVNEILNVVNSNDNNKNYFYKYNISQNTYELLLESLETVSRVQVIDGKIFFVNNSNKLFQVQGVKF